MIYDSPLLWLQEQNTDVWEMLMIELVKCRKKRVNNEFDKKWKKWKIYYYNKRDCLHPRRLDGVHPGRLVAIYVERGWLANDTIYPLYENTNIFQSKYFIYGFRLILTGGYRDIRHIPNRINIYDIDKVVNILRTLSELNNFEFIIDGETTDYDIVKLLYKRENLGTDKHIYCSVEDKIISIKD